MRRTIASIRKDIRLAARELEEEHKPINVSSLARKAGIAEGTLRDLVAFRMPSICIGLHIQKCNTEWNKQLVQTLLTRACDIICGEDRKPSVRLLAEKVGWTVPHVQRYLKHHRDFKAKLGLYSEAQSAVWKTGRQLRFNGQRVTMLSLAEASGYSYRLIRKVMRQMRAHPDFARGISFEFQKGEKGGKVVSYLALCKKTGAKQHTLPHWCKWRISFAKINTISATCIAPEDRILYSVCARYVCNREIVLRKRQEGEPARLKYIRRFVMYLLYEDTELSYPQIGALMGGRQHDTVLQACKNIEPELESLKGEIELLRKLYQS